LLPRNGGHLPVVAEIEMIPKAPPAGRRLHAERLVDEPREVGGLRGHCAMEDSLTLQGTEQVGADARPGVRSEWLFVYDSNQLEIAHLPTWIRDDFVLRRRR